MSSDYEIGLRNRAEAALRDGLDGDAEFFNDVARELSEAREKFTEMVNTYAERDLEKAKKLDAAERELAELETNAVYDKALSEGVERVAKEVVEQNAKLTRELAEEQATTERLREWVEQNDPGLLDEFDTKERKPYSRVTYCTYCGTGLEITHDPDEALKERKP